MGAKRSRRAAAAPPPRGPERCQEGAGPTQMPRQCPAVSPLLSVQPLCQTSWRTQTGRKLHWICSLFGTWCWASCSFLAGLWKGLCSEPPGRWLPLSQRSDFMLQAVQVTHDPNLWMHLQHPAPASRTQGKFSCRHTALLGDEDLGIHSKTIPMFAAAQALPITEFLGATLLNACHHYPGRERLFLCSLAQVVGD